MENNREDFFRDCDRLCEDGSVVLVNVNKVKSLSGERAVPGGEFDAEILSVLSGMYMRVYPLGEGSYCALTDIRETGILEKSGEEAARRIAARLRELGWEGRPQTGYGYGTKGASLLDVYGFAREDLEVAGRSGGPAGNAEPDRYERYRRSVLITGRLDELTVMHDVRNTYPVRRVLEYIGIIVWIVVITGFLPTGYFF
ncbi:MAG: hypothetical protein K5840_05495 [Eubacterium sp.]|nr:hypothetical protein [Eubacterium sp.]